jgi:glycerol-3-phosphate acyltransferase PlsY
MTAFLIFACCWLGSYLLGSVPFGYLVARTKGVDIRAHGSGNIGATNVLRVIGKGPGIFTFTCDVLKGFIPAFVIPLFFTRDFSPGMLAALKVGNAAFAIAGHNWPIFLRFKGGKGIATSAGALLGIAPHAMILGLLVWLGVFKLSRYVSLASITAAIAVAAVSWALWACGQEPHRLVPIALSVLGAVAVWRHKANIKRLLTGKEHRFERKKEQDPEPAGTDT